VTWKGLYGIRDYDRDLAVSARSVGNSKHAVFGKIRV
jgi:hypothetical protein